MSEKSNQTTIETCPYWPGDRLISVDGQIGRVVDSGYVLSTDPHHGKKFVVRLEHPTEEWSISDLSDKKLLRVNSIIAHSDGREAHVIAILPETVVVRLVLEQETWTLKEIAGFADVVIREQAADEYQEQIDDLQRSVDRLEAVNEKLAVETPTPTLPRSAGQGDKIEVMTLVQDLAKLGGICDEDLAARLSAGWELLNCSVSVMYESIHTLAIVRVVTLKRALTPDPSPNGRGEKTAAVEISDILQPPSPPTPLPQGERGEKETPEVEPGKEPVKARVVVQPDYIEINPINPTPGPSPLPQGGGEYPDNVVNMSFEQALRSGQPWQTVAAIGDAEALERGRKVYEAGMQRGQSWTMPQFQPVIEPGVRVVQP